MAKTARKSHKRVKRPAQVKFVVVKNRFYGQGLQGIKIFYEGKKPKGIKRDGSITFGKHILEILKRKFGTKFRLIITAETDSIILERRIYRVRTSKATLRRMGDELRDRTRDIKNDIVSSEFSTIYPEHFTAQRNPVYVPGTLAHMINSSILPRLSAEDREAINKFLPEFIASESLNTVNLLKAQAQIKTLKELADDLEKALDGSYSEGWWQKYIKGNILIIQQGYIAAVEKMNIAVGNTKFPDFSLVTHDNYLDFLEIKRPNTPLLKLDSSRGNYYWHPDIAKALIQTENYIENALRHKDAIKSYISEEYGIELKVLRPRGIILAGDTRRFSEQKESDDFRLLCLSTKNVIFVTYDELLNRLQNYIKVLEEYGK